jgi:hypothetical protein
MSTNPNRMRMMSPLEYVAAMAGYRPPDPMEQQLSPALDAQFQVNPFSGQYPSMPAAQPQPQRPLVPTIPLSALRGR